MAAKNKKKGKTAKRSASAAKKKSSTRKPAAKVAIKRAAVKTRKPAPKKKTPKKAAKTAAKKNTARKVAPKAAKNQGELIAFEVSTIVQEELFDAAPMDVYEAIVDPSRHAAFTGSVATGEPVEGGSFTAWDGYIEGRHERLVPGARIVQVWRTSDFPAEHPASRLELELRPEPEGKTRLRMTHSGVPRSQAKNYEQGWVEHYWNPLREYLRDTDWSSDTE